MTLRFLPFKLRPMAAMMLAFAMLIGGAVDAVACEFEEVRGNTASILASTAMSGQSLAQAELVPVEDGGQNHNDEAGCAHGHCHHGTHSLIANGRAISPDSMPEARYAFAPKRLTTISIGIPKQPPRL